MSDTNVHRVVGNLLVGTSHFFVDTTTNQVGINTSSPSASLDVATGDVKVGSGITLANNGTITATGFSGNGSGLTGVNSDSGSWVNGSSSNIHLAVSTDNVGIGVLDASYKLDVDGDINISSGSTLRVDGTPAVFSNWSVHTNGSDIYRSSGNVGIGVVSPGAELHVGGTGAIIFPAGTTGDRPGTAVNGMFRYNSEIGYMEAYTASGWGALTPPPSIVSISPLTTLPSGGQVGGYGSSTLTEMPQPPNAVDGDKLGWSVAVSGNGMYALAGSPNDDGAGVNSGALHIYVRNVSTNAWTHQQELVIPSINNTLWGYTQYGVSLSNDGTYAVAGAQYHNSNTGQVRVWVRNGTSWSLQQELTISSMPTGVFFGSAVDISEDGNYVIIGAYSDDVLRNGAGAAHIFIRSNATWTHQATLPRTGDGASGDQFGKTVGISSDGTYAIVGSPYGTPNTGSAHIYIRSGTTWTHQKLMVDPNGQQSDAFGIGVHISGDGNYAAIGASNDNSFTGAGFVFVRNGTSWTLQPPQLTITSAATGDYAFTQLKLSQDGTVLVVSARARKGLGGGTYGSFVIFTRVGTTWSQTKEILAPASDDILGHCVDISSDGKTIIAGAYGRDTGGTDRGAMFSLLAAEEIIDASTQVFTVTGTSFDQGLAINLVGADGTNYQVVDRTFVNAATATFKIGDLSSAAAQLANRPYKIKITGGSGLAATSTQTIGFSGISWTSPAAGATLTYYIGINSTQNLVATDDIGGNDVTFSIVSGGVSGLDLNSQTSSPATYGGTVSGSGSSATVIIRVTDNVSGSTLDRTFSIVTEITVIGEAVYTTPGTFAWTAPTDVTSVCVVCVGGGGAGQNSPSAAAGGGGLGWKNNISVSPGSSYTVVVGRRGERLNTDNSTLMDGGDSYFIGTGIVKGGKGRFANTSSATAYGGGGDYTGDGGGMGGDGAWGTSGKEPGGGGAGGYTGNGGRGGNRHIIPTGSAATAGSGGGGGGGGMADMAGSGGGAVGLYGEGANGTAGGDTNLGPYATVAGGGSGGENSYYTTRGGTTKSSTGSSGGDSHGGSPGGGGFGRFGNDRYSFGGYGAVRIMWGSGRSFPNNAA